MSLVTNQTGDFDYDDFLSTRLRAREHGFKIFRFQPRDEGTYM